MAYKKTPATSRSLWRKTGKIPSNDIIQVLLDPSCYTRYATLADLCAAENIPFTPTDTHQLQRCLENDIAEQIQHLGLIMYRYYQVSKKWPLDNEQSIKLAYARHILKVPAEKELTYEDLRTFDVRISELIEEANLQNASETTLKNAHKDFQFALFGKKLILEKQPILCQALAFLGSKQQIYFDGSGIGLAAIFGPTRVKSISPYSIHIITSETARTPNYVMSNPAIHKEHRIALRDESLRAIFHMKWIPVLDEKSHVFSRYSIESDIFWNLSQGIKEKVLSLYAQKDANEVKFIENDFLKDMRETILYHEIGHGLTTEHMLPVENVCIGHGPEIYDIWFYDALLEFLADFAPKQKSLHGAMQNMVETAKKNSVRAERMFYIYLSDIWFYDTDDTFMLPYADFMALVLSRYIRSDQSIDFALMAKDLDYQKDRTDKKQLSLYERVYELFLWDTDEMGQYIKKATFKLSKDADFKYVKSLRLESEKKHFPNLDPNSDTFLNPFWKNMFHYLRVFSDAKPLENYIDIQVKKNMKKMFILAAGRSVAESYKYDHRRYISDTYQKLGFTSKRIPFGGK
jgi:hypothetical protein